MATNITEKDVLAFYGLTNPPYKAERIQTSRSKTKPTGSDDNYDDSEWVIYKNTGTKKSPKWEKQSPSSFISNNKKYNKCSITGEQGIIITDKKKFKKDADSKSGSASSQTASTTSSTDYNTDPYLSQFSEGPMMGGWIEAVDYSPKEHDEKIIKNIQFAKVSLLKECYEWVGLNLSLDNPIENIDEYIRYWE